MDDTKRIREATIADIPRVAELAERFIRDSIYGGQLETTPERVANLVSFLIDHGCALVADVLATGDVVRKCRTRLGIETRIIVGMMGLVANENPISGEMVATEMAWYVEPEFRDGTAGPRLLVGAEVWARSRGCKVLTLIEPWGSGLAESYNRLGYRPIEVTHIRRLV